ncbi:hypothetical protein IQ247_08760 [Plectonema cf. radiosum LEGE 06105]|uniref:Uncharacterized protein n=1 Tax=Plectonema cf. radiosum LEGE 06105 TaxID=945769 RepID=A0A8J7K0S5_9CYAN|nr:hypothetical protein [Plectonema radiosum]MBE9212782.1 hypothetical protein [Plectonema cf. radiosum LEGE 06105]
MNKTVQIQELAIAITAKDLNPNAVNLDFLKYSNIISSDWELARPAVQTKSLTQLVFQNGIAIVTQPNRIVFAEAIDQKDIQQKIISQLAAKFIEKLPNIQYQAVGINPKGFVTFTESNGAANYVLKNLLASGEWREFGKTPVKAAIQLAYTLEDYILNLTINEGLLKISAEKSLPAVLFSGNFNYNIVGNHQQERLQDLHRILQNWNKNLETYQQLINDKFLSDRFEDKNLIPFGISISPSI